MLDLDKYVATYREEGGDLMTCLEEDCDWSYSGTRGALMSMAHLQMEHPRVFPEYNGGV